jgi:hypothetical protein
MEPKNPQIKHSYQEDKLRARMADRALDESARANYTNGIFKPGLMAKSNENDRELGTRNIHKTPVAELKELHNKFGIETEVSGDALARKKAGKPGKYHEKA